MCLIVLFAAGAVLGWLGSIVLRHDRPNMIVADVIAGAVGAVLTGAIANGHSVLVGVSARAFLLAFIGAIVLVGVLDLARSTTSTGSR